MQKWGWNEERLISLNYSNRYGRDKLETNIFFPIGDETQARLNKTVLYLDNNWSYKIRYRYKERIRKIMYNLLACGGEDICQENRGVSNIEDNWLRNNNVVYR